MKIESKAPMNPPTIPIVIELVWVINLNDSEEFELKKRPNQYANPTKAPRIVDWQIELCIERPKDTANEPMVETPNHVDRKCLRKSNG